MQFIGTFGRGLGLNPDEVKMEDASKPVEAADVTIYGGMPMTLSCRFISSMTSQTSR